jgi:outer membrane protein OmpA-like peptidoglycan-associated protein
MRSGLFLFLYCVIASHAQAQTSAKGNRLYIHAIYYNSVKNGEKACKKLEKLIRKKPATSFAYSELGQWYFEAHKFGQAAEVFRKASVNCKNGAKQFAKPYARSLLYAGKPDLALQVIRAYATAKDSAEWNKMRAQAYFIKQALGQPVAHWPARLGGRINSSSPELYPSIAADTQSLYFTRRTNNMDDDLFSAAHDSCGEWLRPDNLGIPPNSPDQEYAQFVSVDGHYLFFTRCENRSIDGWAEGGCDLFMAWRVANDSEWTIAQPFGGTINTTYYEGMPSLSPDNRLLFFVSDRPGGYGGYDIWISRFEDGLWQMPVNAGPSINTPGNETAPSINADNRTLYFTSDGWPGMGGTDIFVSRKIDDTSWGAAMNLGYPINTAFDEKSECVAMDGKKMYFASDRDGPAGNYDLYETAIPAMSMPIPVSYLTGYVYDSLTKERLNYAAVYIRNVKTGETIYQFHSNRGDGSYLIALHLGNTYAIHTDRMGYTSVDDTLVFDKQYVQQPLAYNISMLPSGYLKPINDTIIATLHFDVNRIELTEPEKKEIHDAIIPWLDEKGIVVYVNGYTDNTGTPMINEELSFNRANMVAKELESLGIDHSVIDAKGWGEAKMIAPNDNEEGQRTNRRVEIIIKR